MKRPESITLGNDSEILSGILDFYVKPHKPNASIIDVTANRRRMWRNVTWSGPVEFLDIDPAMNPDIVGDFRKMPISSNSYDVIVFDPPHIPEAALYRKSESKFVGNYGLQHVFSRDNISEFFPAFLREAHRVLNHNGIIISKIKDFIHNHRYQQTLRHFQEAVDRQNGLTFCDLWIKRDPRAGKMNDPKWKSMHHVRNVHCFFPIVRKGGCEV